MREQAGLTLRFSQNSRVVAGEFSDALRPVLDERSAAKAPTVAPKIYEMRLDADAVRNECLFVSGVIITPISK